MNIGVIGAGTMGTGIAQTFAMHPDYTVVLCDIEEAYAQNGKANIQKNLGKLVEKGRMERGDMELALARISTGTNREATSCDLILEAVCEQVDLKKDLFASLQKLCKPNTIFATNTSSLSVTELSAGLDYPVIGMHFFNPAPIMKLVEVVVGLTTPSGLAEKIKEIAGSIGKVPVVVQDSAGFVVNRLLIPMVNEAIAVLSEGVASAEDIDQAMKLGANHSMGPLALGDLVGLDVCLAIMEVLEAESGDPKYRPHPLLRKMVRANYLGRKSGRGFFEYVKST